VKNEGMLEVVGAFILKALSPPGASEFKTLFKRNYIVFMAGTFLKVFEVCILELLFC